MAVDSGVRHGSYGRDGAERTSPRHLQAGDAPAEYPTFPILRTDRAHIRGRVIDVIPNEFAMSVMSCGARAEVVHF